MKKWIYFKVLFASIFIINFNVLADVNVNLINLSSSEQSRLQNTYANSYGFTPQQVAPVMMSPPMEVPTILQIAQNAATVPLAIWGLRKMGFSYMDILKAYSLPPSILFNPSVPYDRFGGPISNAATIYRQNPTQWPTTVVLEDPVFLQLGQIKFLTERLKIAPTRILSLPTDPVSFSRLVIKPSAPTPHFLPPGRAFGRGCNIPPGQLPPPGEWKEIDCNLPPGHWGPPGESRGRGVKIGHWDGKDWKEGKWEEKWEGKEGKWEHKREGKDGKYEVKREGDKVKVEWKD